MATFEQIKRANEAVRATDIKGKMYTEVNERIKAFRMVHPDGCIKTEMISNVDGVCIFRAEVSDGVLLGTGTAYEKEGSTFINKTSYIENCETSAVGRALGMAGFGIDTSVASAEEVGNAIAQQDQQEAEEWKNQYISGVYQSALVNKCHNDNVDVQKLLKQCKLTSIDKMKNGVYMHVVDNWEKVRAKCSVD